MAVKVSGKLSYCVFESFEAHQLPHGLFTRSGGVSPAPWDTLNLGGNNGDSRENVIENRQRLFYALNRRVSSLYDAWQVHSDRVLCVDNPRPLDCEQVQADALLTANSRVTLFMRFADCVPIFVYDPDKKIVGMIHAGWIGTINEITKKTIQMMKHKYHSQAENIIAGIGPSICVDHYPVGEDVIEQVRKQFGSDAKSFLKVINGRTHLDLWRANRDQLQNEGIKQIEISGICTAEDVKNWYSHRAENRDTGRFGAILALKETA